MIHHLEAAIGFWVIFANSSCPTFCVVIPPISVGKQEFWTKYDHLSHQTSKELMNVNRTYLYSLY